MKFRKEDIKVILDNCYVQPSKEYSVNIPPDAPLLSKIEIIEDPRNVEFVNSQVNAIIRLYVQLSPADKKECVSFLLSCIVSNGDQTYAKTAASALIHIGFFDDVLEKTSVNFEYPIKSFYIFMYSYLALFLKHEWNLLTKDQVDKFYKWADETLDAENEFGTEIRHASVLYKGVSEAVATIWRKLNILKTMRLREEIFSETSQEINTDQKALKLEFKRANFPQDLSDTLDKIDIKISTASDNFDFKGCMDLIRAFSERLFSYIAETLDSSKGKKIDGKDADEAAKFFISMKLISVDQAEVVKAFRHFLSNDGVHRLKSRPDDARLSRNMMIEIALYLILRLKDLQA